MIDLIPSINRIWHQVPSGYQPGQTMNRLRQNLIAYPCERISERHMRLTLPQGGEVDIFEEVQGLFMAHIVNNRFQVSGPCKWSESFEMKVSARGWIKHLGIQFKVRPLDGSATLLEAALKRYPRIEETFSLLDFRRARLIVSAGRWTCDIEHFAGSEVVSRVPAGRRYIKLEKEQRRRLLSALLMMKQLMENLNE